VATLIGPTGFDDIRGLSVATACWPNCDTGSIPVLNVNDITCFMYHFAAGHPYGDCDQNGALNVNDFVCFQQRFAAGCSAF
jgi:hypothetical protein